MINRYFDHLKRLKESNKSARFTFEISIILIIKVLLLWLLWALCFSNPIAEDSRQLAVTRILLNQSN